MASFFGFWFQSFVQGLFYATLTFVGGMGFLALAKPKYFMTLSDWSNVWFDTSRMDKVFDKKFDLDNFAIRHNRFYGTVMLAVAVLMIVMPLLNFTWTPFSYGISAIAGSMGVLALFLPQWFIKLTTICNTWVDTSRFTDFIDKPHDVDTKIISHCRIFGIALLIGAMVILLLR